MIEGSVVLVLANIDERIYPVAEGLVLGTAVLLTGDQAWVLFKNGFMWVGSRRMIQDFDPAEQSLQ